MTREEIVHLGTLSRLALTDTEIEVLRQEISAILDYVGVVQSLVGDEPSPKAVGVTYNVMREDTVTTEPGAYTDAILANAPQTHGRFIAVKKILNQE